VTIGECREALWELGARPTRSNGSHEVWTLPSGKTFVLAGVHRPRTTANANTVADLKRLQREQRKEER